MSSTFEYTCVMPKKECSGTDCYCFNGKNQFNTDISTISSVSSPVYPANDGLSDMSHHPICDANCDKPTKPIYEYITLRGCVFCDEECKENFTGLFIDELNEGRREDTLSYESDNDKTLLECELCLSLRDEDEVIYCDSCKLSSCEKCRNQMIAEGGQDCGDLEEFLCPPCYKNSRQHLFFDENGTEISRELFLRQQEVTDWGFLLPTISRGTARHPRVVLNFLRYVDSHNEISKTEEFIFLKPIPQHIYDQIINHSSIQDPPEEFKTDVRELLCRLDRHRDLS